TASRSFRLFQYRFVLRLLKQLSSVVAGRTVDGRIHPTRHRHRSLGRWSRRASEISIAVQPGAIHSAMAIHAPPHAQILDLADALHGFDRTVTLLACDSSIYMRTM